MRLPECSVLWPTNRAEKDIDAVKKAAVHAKIVDLTEKTAKTHYLLGRSKALPVRRAAVR